MDWGYRLHHLDDFVFYWSICVEFFWNYHYCPSALPLELIITNSGFGLSNGQFSKNKGINKKSEEKKRKLEADIAFNSFGHADVRRVPVPCLVLNRLLSRIKKFGWLHFYFRNNFRACVAILVVAIVIFVILRSAYFVSKILGNSGIIAISRIVGFLTIAIGIQYIISAIF